MPSESYPDSKTCTGCGEHKPLTDYTRFRKDSERLRPKCNACSAAQRRRWAAMNRDKINAYMRKYTAGIPAEEKAAEKRKYYQGTRAQRLAYQKQYYEENRTRVLERVNARYAANRGVPRKTLQAKTYNPETARRRYEKHRDRILARMRAAYQQEPEKFKARTTIRLHRERAAEGEFTWNEWIALCKRYGNKCLACGRGRVKLTIDHIVPISRGGTNWITNLQPLCRPCNLRKHAKTIDYRQSLQMALL